MNEKKNVSKRTKNSIFFRKDGGWKSVSTDCHRVVESRSNHHKERTIHYRYNKSKNV